MLHRNTAKKAFTLVELLVVISIIAMLSAILLPAVNQAREAARQSQCSNNMRQLGTAIQNYQATKNRLPDCISLVAGDPLANTDFAGSYVYQILPFIEKNQLKDTIELDMFSANDFDATWFQPATQQFVPDWFIKLLVCPSDPKINNNEGPMSYVPNAGMPDWDNLNGPDSPDDPDNGAIGRSLVGLKINGTVQSPIQMTMDRISSRDGTSTTILLAENSRAGNWVPVPFSDVTSDLQEFEQKTAVMWNTASDGSWLDIPLNQGLDSPNQSAPDFSTPSSRHSGGFLLTFCDGHVTYVSDSISYKIYSKLLTSNGRGSGYVTASAETQANTVEWQKLPVSESDYEAL